MPVQTFETKTPASAEELFTWHTRPGAFERLCPPWQSVEIEKPAPVENGSEVHLRLKKGPLVFRCRARHQDVDPGRGFTDVLTARPFARWVHRHDFEPEGDASVLRDRIDYELAGGVLGRLLAGGQVRRDLATTFAFRHETTYRDLERHRTFTQSPRLRVAVTGSSGLVGGNLVPFLTTGGHQIVRLVRGEAVSGETVIEDRGRPDTAPWQPQAGLLSPSTLGPIDAVVHLAGENIAGGRWTAARKQRIRASRIDGTRNLIRSFGRMENPPRTLVCASAIGYYGSRGDELLDEASTSGDGFLAEVCQDWEEAAGEAAAQGMRVVMLRFGVILTPAGGALAKMLPPFRFGAGGRLGDGRQYMSWVSIDDAIGAIYQALLDDRLSGAVNVVAPEPATNEEFTKALGRTLRRPTLFPVPKLAARAAFGEMADEMLLASARVRPRKLEKAGFIHGDTDLDRTLARLLGRLEMS
jgi:uncharacterized protein (TIGR01777 family)